MTAKSFSGKTKNRTTPRTYYGITPRGLVLRGERTRDDPPQGVGTREGGRGTLQSSYTIHVTGKRTSDPSSPHLSLYEYSTLRSTSLPSIGSSSFPLQEVTSHGTT